MGLIDTERRRKVRARVQQEGERRDALKRISLPEPGRVLDKEKQELENLRLLAAVKENNLDEVKDALAKGAQVNAFDGTALVLAAALGHREIVPVLLDAGADRNAKDGRGWNALAWATAQRHTEIAEMLKATPQPARAPGPEKGGGKGLIKAMDTSQTLVQGIRGTRGKAAFTLDSAQLFAYRSIVEGIVRSDGPSKSKVKVMAEENHLQPMSAGIDPETWDMEFIVRDGLSFEASPGLYGLVTTFGITDPFEETLRKVALHEIGHWEYPRRSGFGCPYEKAVYYASFIEPIFDELKRSRKYSEGFCKTLSERLANAVTDVINNMHVSGVLRARKQHFAGQTLFWYLQGQNVGTYSDEYTLFVKLNLAGIGNQYDQRALKIFMPPKKEIGLAVKRLSKLFRPETIVLRANWERLARAYAKEVIQFIKDEEQFALQYSPGDGSAKGSAGAGQPQPGQGSGSGNQDSGRQPGAGSGDRGAGQQKPGEAAGDKGKDELGKDLSKDDKEKIMMGRKPGQGIPFYMDRNEALDAYYSGLAKRIPIKAAGKLPGAQMPFVPLLRDPYDEEIHDPSDINLNRLYIDSDRGILVPSVVRERLSLDIPIRKEKKHLPDFLMTLMDCSGSMMWGGNSSIVPWGDNSYYHFGILGFYGILRFFETERVLHKMGLAAAIFSDETLDAKGLDEVKKLLLTPRSGGTHIDLQKVIELMRNKENALFSLISDGEIFNWSAIREEFIAMAKRNQFFMIPIGRESQASRELRAAGLHVENPVRSPAEMMRLAIDLTVQRYRSVISRGLAGEAKKYGSM